MLFSSFDEMQKAVDIVGQSAHPTNKIAATLFGTDKSGKPYSISRTNYWPGPIAERIGPFEPVGNSSGTVHAETACILAAPFTKGASLCITDPFCPNCAKNMAEAGIATVYIDHKGFDKDFAARRGDHFDTMSMRICERAGINVYEIRRKEQKLSPILEIPETYVPYEENPVEIEGLSGADESTFAALIDLAREKYGNRKFAVAIGRDENRKCFGLTACNHPAVGYSSWNDGQEIDHPEGKYSYIQEPVNRLLMNAPRNALKIVDGLLFSSHVPTAREQVNLIGANLTKIVVDNLRKSRDETGLAAMKKMAEKGILTFYPLSGL